MLKFLDKKNQKILLNSFHGRGLKGSSVQLFKGCCWLKANFNFINMLKVWHMRELLEEK